MRVTAQAGRVPGLRARPGHPGLPFLAGIAEHDLLQRDLADEPLVVGEPDMAHAPAARGARDGGTEDEMGKKANSVSACVQ